MSRSLLPHDPSRPIGLVFSGGGARGAFQVGVWEALRNDPRGMHAAPDVISGTSAGAMNGALIAAGLSPEKLLAFWLDLARDPPVLANEVFFRSLRATLARLAVREPLRGPVRRFREARILAGLIGKHRWYAPSGVLAMVMEFLLTARFDSVSDLLDGITTSFLFDTRPLIPRLQKAMGSKDLRGTSVRLAINVVDVSTGGVVRIVNYRPDKRPDASATHYRYEPVITPEMILASASIPLLFNPVELGHQTLWDGGLLVNTPLAPAVSLGAHRIVPVLVTPRWKGAASESMSMGLAVERLADSFLENAYNNDRKLLLDRNALAGKLREGEGEFRVVDLHRPIRPESSRVFNAGSYLYFERAAILEMYEAGKRAARRWLDEGAPLDRRELDA